MTEATLKEDIHSYCKGLRLYAKKGDKVKIIRIDRHIAIVEGKERFTVNIEKLKMIK